MSSIEIEIFSMLSEIITIFVFHSRPILPQSLYVSGGNFSSNSFNVKYVKDAFCHPDFNMPTLENNIAVLEVIDFSNRIFKLLWRIENELFCSFQLDRPFDLQSTRDEQWVELADRNTRYSRCSYSIFNATALVSNSFSQHIASIQFRFLSFQTNNLYPFTVPKPSMVLNETACSRNGTYYSNGIEKTHFCAPYHFDHVFMCQLPQNQLRVSFDRGVGVICENKLAGILSIVLAGNNETNSTAPPCINTLQTTALFTRIDTHSTFCHNVIGSRTPEKTPEGQPVPVLPISKPYQSNYNQIAWRRSECCG